MEKWVHIVTAAGGNATAIQVLDAPQGRDWYVRQGQELMVRMADYQVEQVGFLIPNEIHFEMAGGEFCGNAARSAAVLLSEITDQNHPRFTMSGYDGRVRAEVDQTTDQRYDVVCAFIDLPMTKSQSWVSDDQGATLVDLGGIAHVVLEAPFPRNGYEEQHRKFVNGLHLQGHDAVGVCWIRYQDDQVHMDPVVWVRAVDSFFYETSCGSGSIAVAAVTGKSQIIQPSGQTILVGLDGSTTTLRSEMEVVHRE